MAIDPNVATANFINDYNIKVACQIGLITTIQNSSARAIEAIAPNPASGPTIAVIQANETARIAQVTDTVTAAINDEIYELNSIILLDP